MDLDAVSCIEGRAMTPETLDAIRARDAGYSDGFMADDSHPMLQVMRDRRDLLAEVDRLTAIRVVMRDDRDEWRAELKRAEAVIEAARAVNAGSNEWSALRAALAEYDR